MLLLSHIQLFVTLRTVAHQVPLSMGFSRQEYWNGLPFPSPDLPDPGIEPASPVSHALAGGFFTSGAPGKLPVYTPQVWTKPCHLILFSTKALSSAIAIYPV